MSGLDGPDLAALVAARLCHDLISPMGAIGNGLELMQISEAGPSPEVELVADSLNSALARLRLLRVAFGPADSEGRMSREEARALTDGMFRARFTVRWVSAPMELPRELVRTAFLAVLCLDKSLPMGGVARITVAEGRVALSVEGRRVAPAPELWAVAEGRAPGVGLRPDGVQFALLAGALAASGRRLEAEFTASAAQIRICDGALTPA